MGMKSTIKEADSESTKRKRKEWFHSKTRRAEKVREKACPTSLQKKPSHRKIDHAGHC